MVVHKFTQCCFTLRLLMVLLVLALLPRAGLATNATNTLWITNGNVYSVARQGGTVYIGGDFTRVGQNLGQLIVAKNETSGTSLDYEFPRFRGGSVYAVVPDGGGGWYVGGDFTSISDGERSHDISRLGHIRADRTIDTAFKPTPDNTVHALAFDNTHSKLYVGGSFLAINGTTRHYLAKLNPSDAAVDTAWAPEPNDVVRALAVSTDGNVVVVGGDFTQIAGVARNYLTALDYAAGGPDADWASTTADGLVRVITRSLDGGEVFVGGDFTQLGGVACAHLCEITVSSGAVTADFLPALDGTVRAIASNATGTDTNGAPTGATRLYVGGDFVNVGATAMGYLARFDLSTAGYPLDATWIPQPDNIVRALAIATTESLTDRIHVGGDFSLIGIDTSTDDDRGHNRYLAAISTGSTATKIATFNQDGDDSVHVLAATPDARTVVVGGDLHTLAFTDQARVAALSASSGSLDSTWKPGIADGEVRALAVTEDGSAVYAGGSFTQIQHSTDPAVTRNRLARFRANDAGLFDWNPDISSGTVYDMALNRAGAKVQVLTAHPTNNQIIFAGTTNALYRSTDGGATWAVITAGLSSPDVRALTLDPANSDIAYLGTWGAGVFKSTDGGLSWTAFNTGLESLDIFDIGITSTPHALFVGTRFIQGKVSGFVKRADSDTAWRLVQGAEARVIRTDPLTPRLVYLGSVTGVVSYDQEADPEVTGLKGFTSVSQGLTDKDITDLIITTTPMENGDPTMFTSAGGVVYKSVRASLLDSDGKVVLDGNDQAIQTTAWELIRGAEDPNRLPAKPITRIALDQGDITTLLAATAGAGIYRTTDTGVTWTAINDGIGVMSAHALLKIPGADDTYLAGTTLGFIFKTTSSGDNWSESRDGLPIDTLYVAGDFTGAHPNYVAAVTSSSGGGDYFSGWDANSDGPVRSIALNTDRDTLYVGGNFANIGGASRFKLAALDAATAQATAWAPSVDDNEVFSIALNSADDTLYVGGSFTSVSSQTRDRIAAIRTSDGALTDWNPGSDNTVHVLRVINNDNLVVAGGEFMNTGGAARRYLAMLQTRASANHATSWTPNPDAAIVGQQAFFVDEQASQLTLYVGGGFADIGGTGSPSLTSFDFKLPSTRSLPFPQAYKDPQKITLGCDNSGDNPICTQIYYATVADPGPADFLPFLDENDKPITLTLSTTTKLTVFGETEEALRGNDATYDYVFDGAAPQVALNIPGGDYSSTQVVHFTCTDTSGSGCYATFYTLDGSDPVWAESSNSTTGAHEYKPLDNSATRIYHHILVDEQKPDFVPIRVSGELRYVTVDVAGNASAVASERYTIVRVPDSGVLGWIELLMLSAAGVMVKKRRRNNTNATSSAANRASHRQWQ